MPGVRSTFLRFVLLGMLALTTGCGRAGPEGTAPPGAPGPAGGTAIDAGELRTRPLLLGLPQEPDKLSPALNSMVYGTYICHAIYGFLLKYDDTMQLVPDTAVEVPSFDNGGIAEDSLTYTYHLRPGIKWHDGHPLTSRDISFTVDALLDERHEIESRNGYDLIERVETPDDVTVVVHLREPFAPFLEGFLVGYPIWPRHLLESQVGPKFSKAAYHRQPVGLGPFVLDEWVTGSHLRLRANPEYFRGVPGLDEIVFRFITDANTMLVELQSRGIHGYDNAQPDYIPQLEKLPSVRITSTPALMWEHLDFNTADEILKDVRVRQAIQLAIDREEISQEVYRGLYPAAQGDISPRLDWYNPKVEEYARHDPAAAAALLAGAGWIMGPDSILARDGKRLSLSISTTSGNKSREMTENVLMQQLRKVGIELRIQNHNATAFFAPFQSGGVLKRGLYQLGMYAWIASPDPDRFSMYHSSQLPDHGGQNHPRFQDDELDALLDRGRKTLDHAERKRIYDRVQEIIATKVPMTPLVWRADLDPMPRDLAGFRPNPTSVGDTWNIHEWHWQR